MIIDCFCVVMKKDIFLAGTETSSAALQWAMAEMMNKEGVLKRVKEEIDEVVGTNRLVSESDIPNLRYLQAVVKEVLRLHPTAERGFVWKKGPRFLQDWQSLLFVPLSLVSILFNSTFQKIMT